MQLRGYYQLIIHVNHHQVKEQNITSVLCLLPCRGNIKPAFTVVTAFLPLAHLKKYGVDHCTCIYKQNSLVSDFQFWSFL